MLAGYADADDPSEEDATWAQQAQWLIASERRILSQALASLSSAPS
jgi:hypothetical protein